MEEDFEPSRLVDIRTEKSSIQTLHELHFTKVDLIKWKPTRLNPKFYSKITQIFANIRVFKMKQS